MYSSVAIFRDDFREGLLPEELKLLNGYGAALDLVGADVDLLTLSDDEICSRLVELAPGAEDITRFVRESAEVILSDDYYLGEIKKKGVIPPAYRETKKIKRGGIPQPNNHVLVSGCPNSSFLSNSYIRGWNIVGENHKVKLDPSSFCAISSVYEMLMNLPYEAYNLCPLSISIEKLEHLMRTSVYSSFLAEKAGMSSSKAAVSGFLHDMGKLSGIVDYVTEKDSYLNRMESDIIKLHPKIGAILLNVFIKLGYLSFSQELEDSVINTAMTHHLRLDGNGYPEDVSFEEKKCISEIVSICDAYDTMTSGRSYQQRTSPDFAREELKRCSGLAWDKRKTRQQSSEFQFDSELVVLFIELGLKSEFY